MDKFDKAIISELRLNARQSISFIAEQVNLSRSAVTERIKKLEQSGVIRGYQVLLSESQKSGVSAYFEIQHRCARCAEVIHIFTTIPEVITCQGITGDMDLLVYVHASSMPGPRMEAVTLSGWCISMKASMAASNSTA